MAYNISLLNTIKPALDESLDSIRGQLEKCDSGEIQISELNIFHEIQRLRSALSSINKKGLEAGANVLLTAADGLKDIDAHGWDGMQTQKIIVASKDLVVEIGHILDNLVNHVEIKSVFKPTLGIGISSTRNIASGKTDNNGFFSLKFGLNPNEYGQTANTYVSLYFSLDKSKFEPITWYDNFGTDEFLGGFRRKDTTLDVNIFFASIAKVKVTLENFVPIKTGDKFYVETSCAVGLNRHLSQNDEVDAFQKQTEKEIYACGNEQTKFFIIKVKNGVFIETDTTVYTPTGQTVPIKFSY